MECKDVMNEDVNVCKATATAEDCARLMKNEDIGFAPVVDDDGKLVGTVTDRDLCIKVLASGKNGSTKIRDIMSRGVITCQADDDMTVAERKMADNQISRIVVTKGDRCVGVISTQDIVQHEQAQRVHEVQRAIKSEGAPHHAIR